MGQTRLGGLNRKNEANLKISGVICETLFFCSKIIQKVKLRGNKEHALTWFENSLQKCQLASKFLCSSRKTDSFEFLKKVKQLGREIFEFFLNKNTLKDYGFLKKENEDRVKTLEILYWLVFRSPWLGRFSFRSLFPTISISFATS